MICFRRISRKIGLLVLAGLLVLSCVSSALAEDMIVHREAETWEDDMRGIQACFAQGDSIVWITNDADYNVTIYDCSAKVKKVYPFGDSISSLVPKEDPEPAIDCEEEPEETSTSVYNLDCWIQMDQEIYALFTEYFENGTIRGGLFFRLTLENGTAELVRDENLKIDWSNMTVVSDYQQLSRYVEEGLCVQNTLCLLTSDNEGECLLEVFDLADGTCTELSPGPISGMFPSEDGRILLAADHMDENAGIFFSVLDTKTKQIRAGNRMTYSYNDTVSILAYDGKNDRLIYCKNGEVLSAKAFDTEKAVSVNFFPLDPAAHKAFLLNDETLAIWNNSHIFLRDITEIPKERITLSISNTVYNEAVRKAYPAFNEASSLVSVKITDGETQDSILQRLLTRDTGTDIFTTVVSLNQFRAIADKGYYADLSSGRKITEAVDAMYPAFAEALKKDGKIIGIPLAISENGYGYNPVVLKAAGLTADDLPKTWEAFLDFLGELPSKIGDKDICIFPDWWDQEFVRKDLCDELICRYQDALLHEKKELVFNSPQLSGLLTKVGNLDLDALNIPESYEYRYYDYERVPLFDRVFYQLDDSEDNLIPLVLGFDGMEPVVAFQTEIAFVNPWSEHVPEAVSYLERVLEELDVRTKYDLYPALNEPVHNSDFAESYRIEQSFLQKAIDKMNAADEEDKEEWQKVVDRSEKELQEMIGRSWVISPERLEIYHSQADSFVPRRYQYWDSFTDEQYESFDNLKASFARREISAEKVLETIDRMTKMEHLEGN